MGRLLGFICVFLLSLGFTSSPSSRSIPAQFLEKIDPNDINYDLLQEAVEYQVKIYRKKRRYSALEKDSRLEELLRVYKGKLKGFNFKTDARRVTGLMLSSYHVEARKLDYFKNWFNVGVSQRFAMNYFGFQTYFYDDLTDKHQSNYYYGTKIWVEKENDLTKPVYLSLIHI